MGIPINIGEIKNIKRKCQQRKNIKQKSYEKLVLSDLKQRQEMGSNGRNIRSEEKFLVDDYLCSNNELSVED